MKNNYQQGFPHKYFQCSVWYHQPMTNLWLLVVRLITLWVLSQGAVIGGCPMIFKWQQLHWAFKPYPTVQWRLWCQMNKLTLKSELNIFWKLKLFQILWSLARLVDSSCLFAKLCEIFKTCFQFKHWRANKQIYHKKMSCSTIL